MSSGPGHVNYARFQALAVAMTFVGAGIALLVGVPLAVGDVTDIVALAGFSFEIFAAVAFFGSTVLEDWTRK